jgi:hypothetical protein
MLGGLAAMAPLIIVRYGPDDKPARNRADRHVRKTKLGQ